MMFLKNDIISNILPIIIKSDSEEFVIPIMSIAKILEIIDKDNIIINFVIPKLDLKLLVATKFFNFCIFAMRN